MKNLDQKGFGAIGVLLVLLVLAVVGFGGYYVWNTQQDKKTRSTNSQPSSNTNSSTGGPAAGHVATNSIKLTTGQYMPAHIDIKKGETVTWEITDGGEIPKYAIASDTNSLETFSSNDLKTNDKFSHTFNTVGTFGWHDKYDGNLTGSITVTE